MRMSQEEKERSHERIVVSAAKLFRQLGVDGASVNDVMKDAGLTHGGFYKHFDSKDELLGAALDLAFADIAARLGPLVTGDAENPIADFDSYYLSDGHVATPSVGCPIAALSGDIARGAISFKAQFGAGVQRIVNLMARRLSGSERMRRNRAARQLAMMAGAVMIARASDPETAREILSACRD